MRRFATASTLAIIAMTGAAQADVTPQQVWDDFEAYMTEFGYSVSSSEAMNGSTLTVSDIVMSIDVPEEDMNVQLTMDALTLAGQGDGSVVMSYPANMPITINGGDGEVVVTIDVIPDAMSSIISGTPEALNYAVSADKLTFSIADMVVEGESFGPETVRADIVMGPISGTYDVSVTDTMRAMAQTIALGDVAYDIFFRDPDNEQNQFMLKGGMTGLMSAGDTVLPKDVDWEDPAKLVAAGMAVDAILSHTGGNMEFVFSERGDTTQGKTSSAGGEFGFAMSAAAMSYLTSVKQQVFSMSGPEIPLPIDGSVEDALFSIAVPLSPEGGLQNASFSFRLGGFAVSDLLWNIFDPAKALPRDPATVQVKLDAGVTPFVDLLDEEAIEKTMMSGGMPGELNTLKMTELLVEAAGGKITGSGDFVFDNTDLVSFDGLPRPEGKIDLQIAGANGLIDKLITMGLLAEGDAMGARMMLGMFTVPGSAPDTATSQIEINAEGHILANGQRIQ